MHKRYVAKRTFSQKLFYTIVLIWFIEIILVVLLCEPRNIKQREVVTEIEQTDQIEIGDGSLPGDDVPATSTYKPTEADLSFVDSEVGPVNWIEHKVDLKCSAYTASIEECGKSDGITYSGAKAKENHTIAVDYYNPYFEIGTKIQINGITYTVEDTGDLNKYGRDLDIYFDSYEAAQAFGVQTLEVTWYEGN